VCHAGKRVVVLESRARGSGHSGRSLAHLSSWNNSYYKDVIGIAGRDRAQRVAQAHADALNFVERTIKDEGIDCDFQRVPGYLCAHEDSSAADVKLRQELNACHSIGMKDVQFTHITDDKQSDISGRREDQTSRRLAHHLGPDALVFPNCANVHPLRYIEGLAEAVVRNGGQIYEGTRAKAGLPGISGPSDGHVDTMNGPCVIAKDAVVLATHSPINRDQLWVHNRQLPKRTYLIALEVPKGSIECAQWYDTDPDNPHYVRTAPGLDKSTDLLIVEGEAHLHGKTRYPDMFGRLEDWARRHWPQAGKRAYAWSSMSYYPADLLGLYGRDPADFNNKVPNYIITGYHGEEFTGATVGSAVVSSMILKDNSAKALADVYKPGRVFSSALSRYGKELAIYFSWLGSSLASYALLRSFDDVKGLLSPSSVEQSLKPGEGKVAQYGLRKAALFRDADGALHRKSAVCTHLGCQVEWNPLDKSFDCPCHGSQFDSKGRCFNAPAVADLEDLGSDRRP
jgi:glycine/D-amino acid oxidase-like deaminating enzyme/nitrite reductase/ring-hydroxylating ferredoxin subunit